MFCKIDIFLLLSPLNRTLSVGSVIAGSLGRCVCGRWVCGLVVSGQWSVGRWSGGWWLVNLIKPKNG